MRDAPVDQVRIDLAASQDEVWQLLIRVDGVSAWYDGWDSSISADLEM